MNNEQLKNWMKVEGVDPNDLNRALETKPAGRFSRRQVLVGLGSGIAGVAVVACLPGQPERVDALQKALIENPTKIGPALSAAETAVFEPARGAAVTPVATKAAGTETYWDRPYAQAARHEGDVWSLRNSDGAEARVNLANAIGFTPDADLRTSDIRPNDLGIVPADAGNFQAYLNQPRDGFNQLAGYTDGTNDYNQYKDHESGPQVPVYSWMIHTGLDVEMPGIGRVTGGSGRAAMILIINRTERVYRFPTNSVHVEAGFQGWGRIWNGELSSVQESERRLVNHYRTRLGQGVPETGFIGQCDQAADNCDNVTVVTVERMQWGNNSDGTPRDQFRLIRAETVSAVK